MTTAKASIDMLGDLGSKGYEATKSLGEMNMRLMERVMTRQLDAFNLVLDGSMRNIKMVAAATGPNELVRGQLDLARDLSERLLVEGQEVVKLANDSREEYRAWFEQGVQVINEKMGGFRPVP